MIIIAIMGVATANIPLLLPNVWKHFVQLAQDHAAIESTVRLRAHLAKDLESGTPRSESPRSLVLTLPGGRSVRYLTDVVPSRVRREDGDRLVSFPDARLAVLPPAAPAGAWTVRIESTVPGRRPPPVLVTAWAKEVR